MLAEMQRYLSDTFPRLDVKALRDAGGTAGLVAWEISNKVQILKSWARQRFGRVTRNRRQQIAGKSDRVAGNTMDLEWETTARIGAARAGKGWRAWNYVSCATS
ncbi:hypothetical protein ACBJ59_04570 [Nonomuraea sp. MTCD27]|uniref:hypothetical protein n=1 Tax=Nonomuraea sp. MTCD27 TaxID=1676747 RepID=UPI0035C06186